MRLLPSAKLKTRHLLPALSGMSADSHLRYAKEHESESTPVFQSSSHIFVQGRLKVMSPLRRYTTRMTI